MAIIYNGHWTHSKKVNEKQFVKLQIFLGNENKPENTECRCSAIQFILHKLKQCMDMDSFKSEQKRNKLNEIQLQPQ